MSDVELDYEQEEAVRAALRLRVKPLRDHLRLEQDDDENELLLRKMEAARIWVGRYIGGPIDDFILLPADLQEAVLLLAGHFYENREATLVGENAAPAPFGVVSLLSPHAEWSM